MGEQDGVAGRLPTRQDIRKSLHKVRCPLQSCVTCIHYDDRDKYTSEDVFAAQRPTCWGTSHELEITWQPSKYACAYRFLKYIRKRGTTAECPARRRKGDNG